MPSSMTLELPREEKSPRLARLALDDLDHELPQPREEAAALLLSELVTNAVKYGGDGPLRVELASPDGGVRAEVIDEGGGFDPEPRAEDRLAGDGGWGLHLVDALADRWGSFAGSTHVWFEIKAGS